MSNGFDETTELAPIEGPGTEIARVLNEGDPEIQLAMLEKRAELAPRFEKAISAILVSQTNPEDWKVFGDTVCLSSAGAERVARLFDIRFFETSSRKEKFTDTNGEAYRYIFEGQAHMGNRSVFVQGSYSTRDKFLGFANGEYRPVEDVNEGNIRNAAYHIYIGNGVKSLLGLRGMPKKRFDQLMSGSGENASKATKVNHASGTQGGTSQDDTARQHELAEICIAIAESGCSVTPEGKGWVTVPLSDSDDRKPLEIAKQICMDLSGFEGEKGFVKGKGAKDLKGKWLNATLAKAKQIEGVWHEG